MNCTVKITAEEFKNIHNSLWELDCVARDLEDTLHPSLFAKLNHARITIRENLKGAYAQESRDFDRKMDHYYQVREQLGLHSLWSMFDITDLHRPHPWPEALTLEYRDHAGSEGPVIVSVDGPLWSDVYSAADRAIQASGDQHHTFIEAVRPVEGSTTALSLHTGS